MLFLIAVDALPENLSAAESLARNVAGFAASLFKFDVILQGPEELLGGGQSSAEQVPRWFCSASRRVPHWLGCLVDHLLPRGRCWSRVVCAVPGHELQHRAMSSSLSPVRAHTTGERLQGQQLPWVTNYLDFWLAVVIPPQALPAAKILRALPGCVGTGSSSFALVAGTWRKALVLAWPERGRTGCPGAELCRGAPLTEGQRDHQCSVAVTSQPLVTLPAGTACPAMLPQEPRAVPAAPWGCCTVSLKPVEASSDQVMPWALPMRRGGIPREAALWALFLSS